MILGCTHETAGYVGRVLMYRNPWSFAAFIVQISKKSSLPPPLSFLVQGLMMMGYISLHNTSARLLLRGHLRNPFSDVGGDIQPTPAHAKTRTTN
jgi:hypothetical protein